ncbi:hypothetical protein HY442_00275 [Candidatus Parcubacteria bacterium]|nr:hypothetical protein [Candidatus Parcubacteria bacterium]MBI4098948.1 hypothetical protein [Candidatus Parcubacteria bacterium]MBI4385273.1 hypothetical protein [Candidatus Parcubacteria bacterium]
MVRRAVGATVLIVLGVMGALSAQAESDDRMVVRRFEGRHRLAGSEDVSGRLTVTLWSDGNFDAYADLQSLDCEAIRFSVSQRSRGVLFNDWLHPAISAEMPGAFVLDATTLTLDAPLFVHPPTGAVADRGALRRCSGDDPVASFNIVLRSANFAPLGRYDGDISATLLSGATIQRSFSGTFSAVSPMPFRPVIGFQVDPTYRVAGECFNIQWHALPGAARYALEYVGPSRKFTGRVFSAAPELRRDEAWGAVLLPLATAVTVCTSRNTPGGYYEVRVFGLDHAFNVVPGTGSSVPVAVSVSVPY